MTQRQPAVEVGTASLGEVALLLLFASLGTSCGPCSWGQELREEWHNPKQLKSRGCVAKDSEGNFRRQGKWEFWFENGQKQAEGAYKNGFAGGVKDLTGLLVDGRTGRWVIWHDNGQKAAEGEWKEGKPEGPTLVWDEKGQRAAEGSFQAARHTTANPEARALLREASVLAKSDTFKGYEQAIAKAEEALNLDASPETARNARGLLALSYTVRWGEHIHDESNREKAEKHINAGNEATEASALLHAADALFSFYNNRTDEGLKTIEARIQAAEADKKQISIYYLTRGTLQMHAGDLGGAKESLDRAQAIAPDDPRVYVAQGNLHQRRGNDVAALSAFNHALKYTRNAHAEAILGTVRLILDQDDPGKSYCLAAKYVSALQGMADTAAPRQHAANAFLKALLISRVSKELPLIKDAAVRKALEDCSGVKLGGTQAQQDINAAENEGLSLAPDNLELFLIKGRRLAWEGNLDGAAAELRRAIEGNPRATHFHVELAQVLMKKEGGEGAAEQALKHALTLVPGSPKLLAMLGQVQYRQKKYDAARETLDQAVADPKAKNPDASFLLGKLYRDEKKDYAKAAELLKKAGEEYYSDPSMAAAAYDELGVTLEQKGDKDQARANYEKALNADREYAPGYCHYGILLSKDGKEKDKAKEIAKEYLQLAPREACASEMKRLLNR